MTPRTHLLARGGAVAAALLVPLLVLLPPRRSEEATPIPDMGYRPAATSDLASLPPLFGGPASSHPSDAVGSDLPKLVGVAGTFPGDAVALVRLPGGATRTIKVGEPVAGWRLSALEPDRATFARGGAHYDSVLEPIG